jgi:predicted transcriptional regulator YdeE
MLEPKFVDRPAFHVLGPQARIDPGSADYSALWQRFEKRADEVESLATDEGGYAVYFDCEEPGKADWVGGIAVPPGTKPPEGWVLREIPAARYAVFECPIREIGPTWGAILGEWLRGSGYEADEPKPAFEYFPPGSPEGKVPVQIFVAVRAAEK